MSDLDCLRVVQLSPPKPLSVVAAVPRVTVIDFKSPSPAVISRAPPSPSLLRLRNALHMVHPAPVSATPGESGGPSVQQFYVLAAPDSQSPASAAVPAWVLRPTGAVENQYRLELVPAT